MGPKKAQSVLKKNKKNKRSESIKVLENKTYQCAWKTHKKLSRPQSNPKIAEQSQKSSKWHQNTKKSKSQQSKMKLSVYISKPQKYYQALKETRNCSIGPKKVNNDNKLPKRMGNKLGLSWAKLSLAEHDKLWIGLGKWLCRVKYKHNHQLKQFCYIKLCSVWMPLPTWPK